MPQMPSQGNKYFIGRYRNPQPGIVAEDETGGFRVIKISKNTHYAWEGYAAKCRKSEQKACDAIGNNIDISIDTEEYGTMNL